METEEQKTETVDSTNDTASETATEETSETTTEEVSDTTSQDDTEKLKLIESNRKLFERAKKAESELKALRTSQKEQKDAPASFDPLVDAVLTVKSLEADEITELGKEARTLGLDPVKYIKSTSGQALLEKIRKEKKSKEASPEIAGKSPVYKKYSQADLSKMSVAELEKIIPRSDY